MKYVNAILKPFLILVITIFLTTLVPSVAAEFLPFGDTGKAVAAQIFIAMGQILTAFLISLSVKKDNSIIISKHFTLKNVSIKKAAAIAVCASAASLFSVELLSVIFSAASPQTGSDTDIYMPAYIVSAAMGIFIAPACEEIVFRICSYESTKSVIGIIPALLISSAAFSAAHLRGLYGFLDAFIAGIIFSVIYIKTGNAFYSAAAHSISNLLMIVFDIMTYAGFEPYSVKNGYYLIDPTVLVIAAALTVISGIYLKRRNTVCKQ